MIVPVYYDKFNVQSILKRSAADLSAAEEAAKSIIADVISRGDDALREYTLKFDGALSDDFAVGEEEFAAAERAVGGNYLNVLKRSADNIAKFHRAQLRSGFKLEEDGCVVGQRVIPLESAGIYVPGGKAAYPSTVLMNALPAKIAGVKRIVMVTPPMRDGSVKPEVLAAARVA